MQKYNQLTMQKKKELTHNNLKRYKPLFYDI